MKENKPNKIEEMLESFADDPRQLEATALNDEKVVIDTDKIAASQMQLSENFMEFLKENEGRVFTAQTDEEIKTMYSLKESNFWLFPGEFLKKIK